MNPTIVPACCLQRVFRVQYLEGRLKQSLVDTCTDETLLRVWGEETAGIHRKECWEGESCTEIILEICRSASTNIQQRTEECRCKEILSVGKMITLH